MLSAMLSSATLLMQYGFTPDDNPHRIINVDGEMVLATVEEQGGPEAVSELEELIEVLELRDEDGLFFQIGASGALPFPRVPTLPSPSPSS